jgi:hypothetical protein
MRDINELLQASRDTRGAFSDYASLYQCASDLREDIVRTYQRPALWAAVDMLTEYTRGYAQAGAIFRAEGYETGDAFTYALWERESAGNSINGNSIDGNGINRKDGI